VVEKKENGGDRGSLTQGRRRHDKACTTDSCDG
jgi:hypothetical protein